MIKMTLFSMCSWLLIVAASASAVDTETIDSIFDRFWIEENGIPRTDSFINYLNNVLSGKNLAPATKAILGKEFPGISKFTEADMDNLKKVFARAESGRPFFLSTLQQANPSDENAYGSISGVTFKIKQLDGSDFINKAEDFVLIFPYSSDFFRKLQVNDVKKSEAAFRAEVKELLKKCAESGDASCETGLKLFEVGSILPAGSKSSEIYTTTMQRYTEGGKFNTYNLRELIRDLMASENSKEVIKIQPDAFGKFSADKLKPGYWIVAYSQQVLDYLYLVEIKSGSKKEMSLYQPFDHKPYLNLQ